MRRGVALLLSAAAVSGCSSAHGSADIGPLGWRSSAGQAMSDVRAEPARDETCRQLLRLTVGGQQVRLRLSNALSATPLSLSAVTVGVRAAGAAARAGSLRPVTVAGARSIVLPPGAHVVTDPVDLVTHRADEVLVSFAVQGTASLSSHRFGAATGWCSGAGTGDLTGATSGQRFGVADRGGFVLEDVAVTAPAATPRTVVAVGDSLTDAPLPPDSYPRWTDALAQRLPGTPVVSAAIAGNRVLLEGGLGVPLVHRFDRDVLHRAGVGTVVLLAGTNDLARDLSASALQAELQALCEAARRHGARVVLLTIPPADERTPAQRETRRRVNDWIRGSAAADLVVDADAVLRDPSDPERLAPTVDRGDGLHLSLEGHRRLGAAVAAALRRT